MTGTAFADGLHVVDEVLNENQGEEVSPTNQSMLTFSGRCRSCRSFLLSISSGTMDGQSNLHSDVVLVPTPVQFDKQ